MHIKGTQLYAVAVVDRRVPTVGLAAIVVEDATILTEFEDLEDVFSVNEAWGLSMHCLQDLVIKITEGK